jgi:hypothetical protein
MNRKDAFEYFGVTLHNDRAAWSGRNEQLGVVAVTTCGHIASTTVVMSRCIGLLAMRLLGPPPKLA